ncbi:hypothetical protein F2P81_025867 [Scophthalmus maximus]|uniref:Uncharacterized protein n=1 Tax=Scophthalmus maximus TaxID=52904 RepID=A0A6A4RNN0_SCOMX|nr:hypothetical protein F2P81_025867 [Scophthalmus maximus]
MTSEPPDTGLNSLLSGGKNYERLRLQVIVSNESVAHSRVDAVVSRSRRSQRRVYVSPSQSSVLLGYCHYELNPPGLNLL